MWATFTPTKMSGQVLKIYKKTLKVCEPFEGLIATLNEKSQSATISIGSDTNDKSFFYLHLFCFFSYLLHTGLPFFVISLGIQGKGGRKKFYFFRGFQNRVIHKITEAVAGKHKSVYTLRGGKTPFCCSHHLHYAIPFSP